MPYFISARELQKMVTYQNGAGIVKADLTDINSDTWAVSV